MKYKNRNHMIPVLIYAHGCPLPFSIALHMHHITD